MAELTNQQIRTRKIVLRLASIEGHVGAVKRMVEGGMEYPELLIQMLAIRAALNKAAKLLVLDYLEHCLIDSQTDEKSEAYFTELRDALEHFMP